MNKEEIENYIAELESMFELSELEEHSRNILKVGNYIKQLQQENQQLKIQISAREEVYNRLESNWNKLKEYLNYKSERAVGEDEYVYDEIYNEMQELEQGSD